MALWIKKIDDWARVVWGNGKIISLKVNKSCKLVSKQFYCFSTLHEQQTRCHSTATSSETLLRLQMNEPRQALIDEMTPQDKTPHTASFNDENWNHQTSPSDLKTNPFSPLLSNPSSVNAFISFFSRDCLNFFTPPKFIILCSPQ